MVCYLSMSFTVHTRVVSPVTSIRHVSTAHLIGSGRVGTYTTSVLAIL